VSVMNVSLLFRVFQARRKTLHLLACFSRRVAETLTPPVRPPGSPGLLCPFSFRVASLRSSARRECVSSFFLLPSLPYKLHSDRSRYPRFSGVVFPPPSFSPSSESKIGVSQHCANTEPPFVEGVAFFGRGPPHSKSCGLF